MLEGWDEHWATKHKDEYKENKPMSPLKSVFLRHFNYRIQFRGEFSTSIWLRPDRIYNELRPQTIILWQSKKTRKKITKQKSFPDQLFICAWGEQWCDCIVVRVTFQGSVRKKVSETLRGNERPDCSNGICPNLNTMGPRSDPIWRLFQKKKTGPNISAWIRTRKAN